MLGGFGRDMDAPTCDAHGTSKSTWVRQPKTHNANHIERANLQSASALYVPLLHFRRKTAALRSLPPWGLRPRKRSLRLQQEPALLDISQHFAALDALTH